mgnify:CR=1 FL=1
MTADFASSNLSKIKTKLRTSGRVSGNFGRNKTKAGSTLRELGETKGNVGNLPTQDQYLERLRQAYSATTDSKMKKFLYEEIRRILIQRNEW